jgi:hypothetical protein
MAHPLLQFGNNILDSGKDGDGDGGVAAAIKRSVCEYESEVRRGECVVVLIGHVDDSGSGQGQARGNIYVLAGLLSTPGDWVKFSNRFARICHRYYPRPKFKMREAIRLKDDDGNIIWSEQDRDSCLRKLGRLIRRRTAYAAYSVIAWPDYERFVKGRIPAEIDNPYFFLFFNLIFSFASFMDGAGIEGKVDWVFDVQGRVIERECIRWYDWIKVHAAPNISRRLGSTPIFRDDDNVLPLKAADIFAWHLRRHLDRERRQTIPSNEHLNKILNIHGVGNLIQGWHLEDFVANVGRNGLLIKSEMRHFLPPTNMFKRIYNRIYRAIG